MSLLRERLRARGEPTPLPDVAGEAPLPNLQQTLTPAQGGQDLSTYFDFFLARPERRIQFPNALEVLKRFHQNAMLEGDLEELVAFHKAFTERVTVARKLEKLCSSPMLTELSKHNEQLNDILLHAGSLGSFSNLIATKALELAVRFPEEADRVAREIDTATDGVDAKLKAHAEAVVQQYKLDKDEFAKILNIRDKDERIEKVHQAIKPTIGWFGWKKAWFHIKHIFDGGKAPKDGEEPKIEARNIVRRDNQALAGALREERENFITASKLLLSTFLPTQDFRTMLTNAMQSLPQEKMAGVEFQKLKAMRTKLEKAILDAWESEPSGLEAFKRAAPAAKDGVRNAFIAAHVAPIFADVNLEINNRLANSHFAAISLEILAQYEADFATEAATLLTAQKRKK